ncbi:MAG TPA: helix-turn-helix domain-containing protein [Sphingomonadaceae bacterium]|nr:helix-turn-helix domain-containing protein [Sphingomonadaceae bacterium]
MAVAAHFEHAPNGKRRDARRKLALDAEGTPPSGKATAVLIHNLSETGLLLECETSLEEGETIAVDLPHAGPTEARVVWNSGRLHGCQFAEPIGKAALSAAELRSAVETRAEIAAPDQEPFDLKLQRLRAASGLSLARIAAALKVSKPTVWAWEQGRARPSRNRIPALARLLGVNPEDLGGARDTTALEALLGECRTRIAEAAGCRPANVRIMIEL